MIMEDWGGGQREEFPASVSGWALGPLTEGQGRKGPLAPRPPIFPTQGVALKLWPVTPREKYVLHCPPAHRQGIEKFTTQCFPVSCATKADFLSYTIKQTNKNIGPLGLPSPLPPGVDGGADGGGDHCGITRVGLCDTRAGKSQKWDESNFLATYRPAYRNCDFMKMNEPRARQLGLEEDRKEVQRVISKLKKP